MQAPRSLFGPLFLVALFVRTATAAADAGVTDVLSLLQNQAAAPVQAAAVPAKGLTSNGGLDLTSLLGGGTGLDLGSLLGGAGGLDLTSLINTLGGGLLTGQSSSGSSPITDLSAMLQQSLSSLTGNTGANILSSLTSPMTAILGGGGLTNNGGSNAYSGVDHTAKGLQSADSAAVSAVPISAGGDLLSGLLPGAAGSGGSGLDLGAIANTLSSSANLLNSMNTLGQLANSTDLTALLGGAGLTNLLGGAGGGAGGLDIASLLSGGGLNSLMNATSLLGGTDLLSGLLGAQAGSGLDITSLLNPSNLLGTTNNLLDTSGLLGGLLGGTNAGAADPTKLMQSVTSTIPNIFGNAGGASTSSDTYAGIAQAYITNGYLNIAGQNALKLSGLANQAYLYPDLAAALNGEVPVIDNSGQLTQAVQSGLQQIGIAATTPSQLVNVALSKALGQRRRVLAAVAHEIHAGLKTPSSRLRRPTAAKAGDRRQLIADWFQNAMNSLGTAADKIQDAASNRGIESALDGDDWKGDVQKAANELANQLEGITKQLKDGELPNKIQSWWKDFSEDLKQSVSDHVGTKDVQSVGEPISYYPEAVESAVYADGYNFQSANETAAAAPHQVVANDQQAVLQQLITLMQQQNLIQQQASLQNQQQYAQQHGQASHSLQSADTKFNPSSLIRPTTLDLQSVETAQWPAQLAQLAQQNAQQQMGNNQQAAAQAVAQQLSHNLRMLSPETLKLSDVINQANQDNSNAEKDVNEAVAQSGADEQGVMPISAAVPDAAVDNAAVASPVVANPVQAGGAGLSAFEQLFQQLLKPASALPGATGSGDIITTLLNPSSLLINPLSGSSSSSSLTTSNGQATALPALLDPASLGLGTFINPLNSSAPAVGTSGISPLPALLNSSSNTLSSNSVLGQLFPQTVTTSSGSISGTGIQPMSWNYTVPSGVQTKDVPHGADHAEDVHADAEAKPAGSAELLDAPAASHNLTSVNITDIQHTISKSIEQSLSSIADKLHSGGVDALFESLGGLHGIESLVNTTSLESLVNGLQGASHEKLRILQALNLDKILQSLQNQAAGVTDLASGLGTLNTSLMGGLGSLGTQLVNGGGTLGSGLVNLNSGLGSMMGNINSNLGSSLLNLGGGLGNLASNLDGLGTNIQSGLSNVSDQVSNGLSQTGGWSQADLSAMGEGINTINPVMIPDNAGIPDLSGASSGGNVAASLDNSVNQSQQNLNYLLQSLKLPTLDSTAANAVPTAGSTSTTDASSANMLTNLLQNLMGSTSGSSIAGQTTAMNTAPTGATEKTANEPQSALDPLNLLGNTALTNTALTNPLGSLAQLTNLNALTGLLGGANALGGLTTALPTANALTGNLLGTNNLLGGNPLTNTLTSTLSSLGLARRLQAQGLQLQPVQLPSLNDLQALLNSTPLTNAVNSMLGNTATSNINQILNGQTVSNSATSSANDLSNNLQQILGNLNSNGNIMNSINQVLGSSSINDVLNQNAGASSGTSSSVSNDLTNHVQQLLDPNNLTNQINQMIGQNTGSSVSSIVNQDPLGLLQGSGLDTSVLQNLLGGSGSSLSTNTNTNTNSLLNSVQNILGNAALPGLGNVGLPGLGNVGLPGLGNVALPGLGNVATPLNPTDLTGSLQNLMGVLPTAGTLDPSSLMDSVNNLLGMVQSPTTITPPQSAGVMKETQSVVSGNSLGHSLQQLIDDSVSSPTTSQTALQQANALNQLQQLLGQNGKNVQSSGSLLDQLRIQPALPTQQTGSQAVTADHQQASNAHQQAGANQQAVADHHGAAANAMNHLPGSSQSASPAGTADGITPIAANVEKPADNANAAAVQTRPSPSQGTAGLNQLLETISQSNFDVSEFLHNLANSGLDLNSLVARGVEGKLTVEDVLKAIAESHFDLNGFVQSLASSGLNANDIVSTLANSGLNFEQLVAALHSSGFDLNQAVKQADQSGIDLNTALATLVQSGVDVDQLLRSGVVESMAKTGGLSNEALGNLLNMYQVQHPPSAGGSSSKRQLQSVEQPQPGKKLLTL